MPAVLNMLGLLPVSASLDSPRLHSFGRVCPIAAAAAATPRGGLAVVVSLFIVQIVYKELDQVKRNSAWDC